MLMVEPYNPDCPAHCPPDGASPFAGDLLRASKKFPPAERDMLSLIEQGRDIDPSDCRGWGLSVWLDEADARHALAIVPFFRTCSIVRFAVEKNDGVLMHTPSNDQPEHHTYWKKFGVQIPAEKFALVIGPEKR
jgi:hypothetical protein